MLNKKSILLVCLLLIEILFAQTIRRPIYFSIGDADSFITTPLIIADSVRSPLLQNNNAPINIKSSNDTTLYIYNGHNCGLHVDVKGIYGIICDADSYGIYIRTSSNYGIHSKSINYAVKASSNENYGIYGQAVNSYGVYGKADSYGIYGYANNNYGVYGEADNDYGIYGKSNNDYGIYGRVCNNYGIFGYADNNYGVCGIARNYGGFFIAGDNYALACSTYEADSTALWIKSGNVLVSDGDIGMNTTGDITNADTISANYFIGQLTGTSDSSTYADTSNFSWKIPCDTINKYISWDTLGAYYDTTYSKSHFNFFDNDSISWDTLNAYPDTTVTNDLRDSIPIVAHDTANVVRSNASDTSQAVFNRRVWAGSGTWPGNTETLAIYTPGSSSNCIPIVQFVICDSLPSFVSSYSVVTDSFYITVCDSAKTTGITYNWYLIMNNP